MARYPSHLAPDAAPPHLSKAQKSRARREPSGVFQMFSAPQIQQFKEAFSLIDQDGDGIISEKDLKAVFVNLGIPPKPQTLNSLLSSRPGGGHFRTASNGGDDDSLEDRGVNFAMFLTMMGERLVEFDTEAELLEAFECFDENDSGAVKVNEVRKWLTEVGDRMQPEEIDQLFKPPFLDERGNFKYREWIKVVRVVEEEPEER